MHRAQGEKRSSTSVSSFPILYLTQISEGVSDASLLPSYSPRERQQASERDLQPIVS
jgi:hypothetical protein